MNIRKVNLHLLIALEALLDEVNVTRASQRVSLSQPAMTHSLNQLRELFNDQLLVRTQNKMVLTPKAESLKTDVSAVLSSIELLIGTNTPFDPSTATCTFNIAISDYMEFTLLPLLVCRAYKQAPQIKFRLHHLNMLNDVDVFKEHKIDVGIGLVRDLHPDLMNEILYEDEYVCITDKHNGIIKKALDLPFYLSHPHVAFMSDKKSQYCASEVLLNAKDYYRNNVLFVSHIFSLVSIIKKTPIISTTLKKVAVLLNEYFEITIKSLPIDLGKEPIYLVWHKKDTDHPPNQWLRQLIKSIVKP